MSDSRWPALLTGPQACEFLGISKHTLLELIANKFFPRVKIPTLSGTRATRFRRTDLENFVENLPVGINQNPEQLNPTVVASEEDADGEYGPVWARETDRVGGVDGPLFQLYYWDSGISGANPGYKCTWQWLDNEQVIETGFCPVKCETSGQITVSSLGPATVDSPFVADIAVSNADGGSVSAADLPPGLSVDGDGAITGTPTTAGTFYPIFTATADKTGTTTSEKCNVTRLIPITVDAAPEPS